MSLPLFLCVSIICVRLSSGIMRACSLGYKLILTLFILGSRLFWFWLLRAFQLGSQGYWDPPSPTSSNSILQVFAGRAILKVIKTNRLCHLKGDPTHEEQLSPDGAGSLKPLVIVKGTAAVWRTLIGCLTGDKLCFCLLFTYLALSQMLWEARPSPTPLPQTQVLIN